MLLSQYNPGGRWSGGGTGGGTEGQVHVEVERLGTKAEPAGQSTKAEQETRVKPTEQGARAEQMGQKPTSPSYPKIQGGLTCCSPRSVQAWLHGQACGVLPRTETYHQH